MTSIPGIPSNVIKETAIEVMEVIVRNVLMFCISLCLCCFFIYLSFIQVGGIIGVIGFALCAGFILLALILQLIDVFKNIKDFKSFSNPNDVLDDLGYNNTDPKENLEISMKDLFPIKWIDLVSHSICIGGKGLFLIFKTKNNYKVFALANVLDYDAKGTDGYKLFGEYLTIVKAKEEVKKYLQDIFDSYQESLNEND